jgi:hypothetical protein
MRKDLDGQLQGQDDLQMDDLEGVYDLGVDEYYLPDVIFRNDFESAL